MDNQNQNTNSQPVASQPVANQTANQTPGQTPNQPADQTAKPQPAPLPKKFIAITGAIVGIAVLAAVIVTIILTRPAEKTEQPQEEPETTKTTEDEEEELENTPLKAGSVTTNVDGKSVTYKAAYVVDGFEATIGSGTYETTEDGQVAILVINGGSLRIKGNNKGDGKDASVKIKKAGIVVVGEDSKLEIDGAAVETAAANSPAIAAVNGGKVTAKNTTLNTSGAGSPLIYSTGKITVEDSTGTAAGAQIAVVEGKNSITLKNDDFKTNGNGNRNGVDNAAIMIYQSMSGDADKGTGTFTAENCQFTILEDSPVYKETPFFFVTNTTAAIELNNVTATFSPTQKFISAKGTSEWGEAGKNGGTVNLSASNLTATNREVTTDGISVVLKR